MNANNSNQDPHQRLEGRLVAIDLGAKRVGVAVCDELQVAIRRLPPIETSNWKELVHAIQSLLGGFDAKAVVIGLPRNMDGTEGDAATHARRRARDLKKSLNLPIFLQDERLTSEEAREILLAEGLGADDLRDHIDSQSAVLILRDFLAGGSREAVD